MERGAMIQCVHPARKFYPMFQRYFDAGLAQASYLLACERTRQAIVIDPRRDVDVYVEAAREHQLTIAAAIDTHIHADFLSGARELAAAGSQTIAGPGSSLKFASHEVGDGERLSFGDLSLRVVHTPGHTPEHISIVVEQPQQPARVFTGDTLFVGAVGRPDLLGEELARGLARDLYDSLFHKLLTLPDDVEIHPGHGAGSLCGSGIGVETHSTIGWERRANPLLACTSRDQFISAVLGDLPETPSYFARMKRANQDGPPLRALAGGYAGVPAMSAAAAAAAVDRGARLIDLRNADAFCAGHPAGALHIGFGSKVGYWAGWVLPGDTRVVLLTPGAREGSEAGRQLLRVGFDDIAGHVDGGFDAWRAAGLPVARIPQIGAAELQARLEGGEPLTVVDVRSAREWDAGHISGAVHLPVSDAASGTADLRGGGPFATICEGGTRSMLVASLLARRGLTRVVNVTGGMNAYRALIR